MSLDIKAQVIARMKKAGAWSYQLDESTDVGKDAQLLVFTRYEGDTDIEEQFLICTPLETTTTGLDIFNVLDTFQQEEALSWENCVSLCTDGAPAMLGARQGFTARVKQVNPKVGIFHCLLHRENLAAQHLSKDLSAVMQEVVAVVNFVKASALNSRLFALMCCDFGSEYQHLLYYSSVRWLSRGKVLRRVVDLRTELEIFLREKNHRHAARFTDRQWMLKVCYLNDVFAAINELNTSMQGRDQSVITLSEKLLAFKEKLVLWKRKLERGRVAAFPSLNAYLEEWEENGIDAIKPILVNHLDKLTTEFDRYIPDHDLTHAGWIRDPFQANVDDLSEEIPGLQEQWIELRNEDFSRRQFAEMSLGQFWTAVKKDKPIIGEEVMKVLVPFGTTYLCEQGFSALTNIKTKQRNALEPCHDLRVALTSIAPRLDSIIANKAQRTRTSPTLEGETAGLRSRTTSLVLSLGDVAPRYITYVVITYWHDVY
ncbi:PREDICTED: protein FAM200A-like [Priapulus caudatus]|uniref:Protein FAM200A-like n=1 Tax=Priapulus caudatus TaxID=37621 RepID=A0ABM1DW57_PRICU|nr:PREDICTED: protein FAM200A-like [Priapulus caudatus]